VSNNSRKSVRSIKVRLSYVSWVTLTLAPNHTRAHTVFSNISALVVCPRCTWFSTAMSRWWTRSTRDMLTAWRPVRAVPSRLALLLPSSSACCQ
jgi:hypothetical protein